MAARTGDDPVQANRAVVDAPAPVQQRAVSTPATHRLLWVRRFGPPTLIFVVWRLTLEALGYAGTFLFPPVARAATAPYTLPPTDNLWLERGLNVWTHWDGEWYIQIVTRGYAAHDGTPAFFPLYPALVKTLGLALGGGYVLAGVLLSALLAWLAFVLLYELARFEFGSPRLARRTTLALALAPGAFFLAAVYTESLFLAATLAAFLAFRRGAWWWAGAAALLAVETRAQGLLLLAPMLWQYARQHGWDWRQPLASLRAIRPRWNVAALALPLLGFGAWLAANALLFGNAFQFATAQTQWKRTLTAPWTTIINATTIFFSRRSPGSFLPRDIGHGGDDPTLLDYGFGLFFIAVIAIACAAALLYTIRTRRTVAPTGLPAPYLLYAGSSLLLALLTPAPAVPFLSIIRIGMVIFPVYFALVRWAERHGWLWFTYTYVAPVLLGLLTLRFVNWYWVA